MEDNDVGIYKGKYYKAVEFRATKEGDIPWNVYEILLMKFKVLLVNGIIRSFENGLNFSKNSWNK